VEDSDGAFDWAEPTEELFAFINQLERSFGTYLYGRRMYETMVYWEGYVVELGQSVAGEFADIWKAANKIVFSRTLRSTSSVRTTIEREFDADSIRRMKENLPLDISVGGAELASIALSAGLVDEVHLFLMPLVVGAGKPVFSSDDHVVLELLEERRFANGQLFLRYSVSK